MNYKARLSSPSLTNKYYIHYTKGGVNECIRIRNDSVLPNCVGYAWGRFYEISKNKPNLCRGNAELWWKFKDGYKRSSKPEVGAVICWSKGTVGNSKDGAGHVAIVEKVSSDGTIVISQSGYNTKRFWTSVLKPPYILKGYKLQGFILNPAVKKKEIKIIMNTVKLGSKGNEVKTLQRILNCYYGNEIKIDGSFGYITERYVKKIQKKFKLKTDGICGKDTWYYLLKELD